MAKTKQFTEDEETEMFRKLLTMWPKILRARAETIAGLKLSELSHDELQDLVVEHCCGSTP